jgi:thiazole synthase
MQLYDTEIGSRLLIGTALYPSPSVMAESLKNAGAEVVTVSLRREASGGKAGDAFWNLIRSLGVKVLPNTAGCRTVKEAVATAELARELFGTPWIKLEVIGDDETLQPGRYWACRGGQPSLCGTGSRSSRTARRI